MASIALRPALRTSQWHALMVSLAIVQSVVWVKSPTAPMIALGIWWNSNTISHNFIHRPFFRTRAANLLFGVYLSVLLGIPQSLWRDRHLAHHANVRPRLRFSGSCR
jgi:fatty acid desaturase